MSGLVNRFAVFASLSAGWLASYALAETFYYTGPTGGDFFNESNWNSIPAGGGVAPAPGSIEPSIGFTHDLIIDGDEVMATGPSGFVLDIGAGGGLSLLAGSELQVTNDFFNAQFEVSSEATFHLADAILGVDDDIFLRGTSVFTGGLVETFADDLEFRTADMTGTTTIMGTTFQVDDSLIFEAELTPAAGNVVQGAIFGSAVRIGIRHFNVTVEDTQLTASGDLENVFTTDLNDATGTLTLLGASTLSVDQVQEGVKLRLGSSSTATLTNSPDIDEPTWFSQSSTVTLDSPDAALILLNAQTNDFIADFDGDVDVDGQDFLIWQRGFGMTGQTNNSMGDADGNGTVDGDDLADWRAMYLTTNARFKVINGVTGLSYALDPSAWNVTDWNGIDPVTLSIVSALTEGHAVQGVPEPASIVLALVAVVGTFAKRRRSFP